jgi:hypothetical protein
VNNSKHLSQETVKANSVSLHIQKPFQLSCQVVGRLTHHLIGTVFILVPLCFERCAWAYPSNTASAAILTTEHHDDMPYDDVAD